MQLETKFKNLYFFLKLLNGNYQHPYIIQYKRSLRTMLKGEDLGYECRFYCDENSSDSYVEIYIVECDNIEDFIDYIYIPSPCSNYDCTGKPFTVYIDKAPMPNGKWYLRHYVSYDV